MPDQKRETYFAPPGRSTNKELEQDQLKLTDESLVQALMDAMPDLGMILNCHRQIIAVNEKLLKAFDVEKPDAFIGKRPGEAFGCVNYGAGPDGCGTAEKCSVCGAVLAILTSQESHSPSSGECRLTLDRDGAAALDIEAKATPIEVSGSHFTVLALRDISDDKRRVVLERLFFHDISNTVGGIRGVVSLLAESDQLPPSTEKEYQQWLIMLSDNLLEEISHQRRLFAAERGDFIPSFEKTDIKLLLEGVQQLYNHHERTPGRQVVLNPLTECSFRTDRAVLRRIVGNMVLNALEASKRGDTVSINAICAPDYLLIEVSNPGEISPEAGLQIFSRSFSTKGETGRGLGTYSIKLFAEKYLKGTVGFTSAGGITTFYVKLPKSD